jgi:hypothetical protein
MKIPFGAVRTEIGAFELALLQAADELDRSRAIAGPRSPGRHERRAGRRAGRPNAADRRE